MGSLWLLDMRDGWLPREFDKPSKYFLALPCLAYALAFAPRLAWLWGGVWLGACGSGALALYQTSVLHLPRATGYTNAIQYGNLCVLLALMCLVLLATRPPGVQTWRRLVMAVGVVLGLVGSVLSQSRGGWVALALIFPALALVLRPYIGWRQFAAGTAALLCALSVLVFVQRHGLEERLDMAVTEAQQFEQKGDAVSSVGQRLAHWQLAWDMGLARPLLGWGKSGYDAEKKRQVNAGQAHPFLLEFAHVHNEVLDLFAKHGLLGVLALLLFYGVPLALFWPTRARVMVPANNGGMQLDRTALALHLVGWTVPVAYIAFGLTQVFFAHNSGNVFYLFMVMLVHSCLQARQHAGGSDAHPAGQ